MHDKFIKFAKSLLIYLQALGSILLLPLIMFTSPLSFGRSKEFLDIIRLEFHSLRKDALFHMIKDAPEVVIKLLGAQLKKYLSSSPSYWDFLAEREYRKFGTPRSLPLLEQGFSLRQLQTAKQIEGSTRFFGPEWASVFGHITGLSLYPKLERLGWVEERVKVLLYRNTASQALLQHYKKYYGLCRLESSIAGALDIALRDHYTPMNLFNFETRKLGDLYSAQNEIEAAFAEQSKGLPFQTLDPEVELKALDTLRALGFDSSSWFVTLHMRENKAESSRFRGADNVNPQDYIPAIRRILESGGSIIRIGDKSMTPLKDLGLAHPKLLDYAHSSRRNSSVDIYALSRCKFFLGTQSGPVTIPNEFGVPVVYTNVVAFGRAHRYRGFMIPSLIKNEKGKVLSFEESLRNPLAWNVKKTHDEYVRVKNSPADIEDATALAVQILVHENSSRTNLDFRFQEDCLGIVTRGGLPLHTPIPVAFSNKYGLLT